MTCNTQVWCGLHETWARCNDTHGILCPQCEHFENVKEREMKDVCCMCGKEVAPGKLRVPEFEPHDDYCLECYVENGFADLWEIVYLTFHGDFDKFNIDVPPGTHPFKIRGYGKEAAGLAGKVASYRKLN